MAAPFLQCVSWSRAFTRASKYHIFTGTELPRIIISRTRNERRAYAKYSGNGVSTHAAGRKNGAPLSESFINTDEATYLNNIFGVSDSNDSLGKPMSIDPSATTPKPDSETEAMEALESSENYTQLGDAEEFEPYQGPRPPRAVQAAYLCPLRRQPVYNIPVCDLQLRSYSVANLEFMADFALRAAYFLDLPASGPIPLPQIVERWTVPKAHFIHKKLQENFERKTLRRLIQIKDGDSEVVRLWLGFLRKHAYHGVGMKANVWEFAGIDVAKDMDAVFEKNRSEIDKLLAQYAFKPGSEYGDKLLEIANQENRWQASGGSAPMISTPDWRKPLN